ncbi:hypothetical protein TNCT_410391, partial [Trichonephila clavata]
MNCFQGRGGESLMLMKCGLRGSCGLGHKRTKELVILSRIQE